MKRAIQELKPEMMMIKYNEAKLPKVKDIASSWTQLAVYVAPCLIVALGKPVILDFMITEVRHHAQRHKQDIETKCFHYYDWLEYREASDHKETTGEKK